MQGEEIAKEPATDEVGEKSAQEEVTGHPHTVRRALKFGCLILLLAMCSCLGTLAIALQRGPVNIALPWGNSVRIGSDDFVLKDYSFRNGTTYFIDWNGNGARNILEFRFTEDNHSLDVVVHHADPQAQGESKLITVELP